MKSRRSGLPDIVKFIACICIMAGHYSYIFQQEYENVKVSRVFFTECSARLSACVALFFVISGFFAARSFDRLADKKQSYGDFIKKKVLRLFPGMWVSMLYFVLFAVLFLVRNGHWWGNRNVSLSEFILAACGVNMWTAGTANKINGPIWYISILFLNMLLFGFISSCRLTKPQKKACFAVMIALGLSVMNLKWGFTFLAQKTARGYAAFFTGVLLGLFADRIRYKGLIGWTGVLLTAALSVIGRYAGMNLIGDNIIVYTFVLTPALLLLSDTKPFTSDAVSNGFTSYLGRISFPIFLTHIPCYVLFSALFADTMPYNSYKTFLLVFAMTFVLAVLLEKLAAKIRIDGIIRQEI
ncbi:MAG: acyltransferase [Solobacterium sp.]|nr:acyltransferase [Solobacterium sp.]